MAVVRVTGFVRSPQFHAAVRLAKALLSSFPERLSRVEEEPLMEIEWQEFLAGATIKQDESVLCFVDGKALPGAASLLLWAQETGLHPPVTDSNPAELSLLADEAYKRRLKDAKNPLVFMEISIDQQPAGRLVFELYPHLCPRASENFRALCAGDCEESTLSYRGSIIHRVVPRGWIQGGDIAGGHGNGGMSIHGPEFEDESFAVQHARRGVLGMANRGRHSNASQFYVTLQPCPWMDRKYVAFGQLVEGAKLLARLEEVPAAYERPTLECRVSDCGPCGTGPPAE